MATSNAVVNVNANACPSAADSNRPKPRRKPRRGAKSGNTAIANKAPNGPAKPKPAPITTIKACVPWAATVTVQVPKDQIGALMAKVGELWIESDRNYKNSKSKTSGESSSESSSTPVEPARGVATSSDESVAAAPSNRRRKKRTRKALAAPAEDGGLTTKKCHSQSSDEDGAKSSDSTSSTRLKSLATCVNIAKNLPECPAKSKLKRHIAIESVAVSNELAETNEIEQFDLSRARLVTMDGNQVGVVGKNVESNSFATREDLTSAVIISQAVGAPLTFSVSRAEKDSKMNVSKGAVKASITTKEVVESAVMSVDAPRAPGSIPGQFAQCEACLKRSSVQVRWIVNSRVYKGSRPSKIKAGLCRLCFKKGPLCAVHPDDRMYFREGGTHSDWYEKFVMDYGWSPH